MNNQYIKYVREFFDRAYIRLDKAYDIPSQMDFDEDLLSKVAVANSGEGNQEGLFITQDGGTEKMCERKTRRFLARKATAFVMDVDQYQADESMATFISIKQVKTMKWLYSGKKHSIPAYAPVVIYVAYQNVLEDNEMQEICCRYLDALKLPIQKYTLDHRDDSVAEFCLRAYDIVGDAIRSGNRNLTLEQFPPIPKIHPRCMDDF